MERLGSNWTDFYEIWHLNIFRKSVEKIQVSLKSDKNNECFTCRPIHIFGHISVSTSKMEKCFRQNLLRKSKHIMYSITFSRKSCRVRDNVENMPDRTHMTIWRMRVACWITKATNTQYVIIIIIIIFIYCNWVVTRWQWLFYIYTKHETGYY